MYCRELSKHEKWLFSSILGQGQGQEVGRLTRVAKCLRIIVPPLAYVKSSG